MIHYHRIHPLAYHPPSMNRRLLKNLLRLGYRLIHLIHHW
jgi:hypothetical protein